MHDRRTLLASFAALTLAGCSRDRTTSPSVRTNSTPRGTTGDTGTTADTGTIPSTAPTGPGPEPEVWWDPPGELDAEVFACGVQTGDATEDSIIVSVRQFDEPEIEIVVVVALEEGFVEVARLLGLTPDEGVVQIEVSGLLPDHTHGVVAYAPDGVRRSNAARFRTALPLAWSRPLRIGATSCFGSLGAPWASVSRVAAEKLDVFLLLGDTIYADEGIRPAGDWEGHWNDALATAGLRDITASTSVVATWDDHEVLNDFVGSEHPVEGAAGFAAFRRGIPQRPGPSGGIWRKLSWGSVLDLFVLDCRGERTPETYLGSEQRAWLESELLASTARFKILLNSVPITDMGDVLFGIANSDGWMDYPDEREAILAHIAENGITGVLWVAGDVHWGSIATVDPPDGTYTDPIEIICGPAGSLVNPVWRAAPADHYALVVGEYNSVIIELDPDTGTVRVLYEGNTARIAERQTQL